MAGFTQALRAYNFDTEQYNTPNRLDLLSGVRAGGAFHLQEVGHRFPLLLMAFLIRSGTALYHAGSTGRTIHAQGQRWVDGRKGLWGRLEVKASALQGCLWIHCASVGEFEQARPILESVRASDRDFRCWSRSSVRADMKARMDFPRLTHVGVPAT
ncbi:MAG: hypothetical protein IPI72_12195 [Flavobacteriales bacterium]|nr:hypothetical protein [Flavobacteriales bacterium]